MRYTAEHFFWKAFKRLRRLFVGKYFTYFAGPIDLEKDKGVQWRKKYAPLCVKNIPVIIQDPTQEQCRKFGVKTIQESHKVLFKIREEQGDKAFFETIRESFYKPDLRMVRNSDFIIVYWNFQGITVGTIHEMVEAVRMGIPIYFLTDEEGMVGFSTWLQTLIWMSGGKIFANSNPKALFGEAFKYLGEEYSGKRNASPTEIRNNKEGLAETDLNPKDE